LKHQTEGLVAVSRNDLEVPVGIFGPQLCLQPPCLGGQLEENQPRKLGHGIESDPRRSADRFAGPSAQVAMMAGEEVEVEGLRRSLGCRGEGWQVGSEHGELLLCPEVPRP
jgi:hypothetical protein